MVNVGKIGSIVKIRRRTDKTIGYIVPGYAAVSAMTEAHVIFRLHVQIQRRNFNANVQDKVRIQSHFGVPGSKGTFSERIRSVIVMRVHLIFVMYKKNILKVKYIDISIKVNRLVPNEIDVC